MTTNEEKDARGASRLHAELDVRDSIGHGYCIHWNNGKDSVSVTGCATPQEAYERAIAFAKDSGWTRPKWWQFWRWNDSNPQPPSNAELSRGAQAQAKTNDA